LISLLENSFVAIKVHDMNPSNESYGSGAMSEGMVKLGAAYAANAIFLEAPMPQRPISI